MNRVTINIGFYYEKYHYAQLQAYIPRNEAISIPQLSLDSQHARPPTESEQLQKNINESEDEYLSEEEEAEPEPMDVENAQPEDILEEDYGEAIPEEEGDEEEEEEEEEEELAQAADSVMQEDIDEDNFLDDDSDSEVVSSLSGSAEEGIMQRGRVTKTKRQKGYSQDLVQLPDKRPRKGTKKLDEASEIIRREEKYRKRKQYLKKQMEAQEKATLEKILNETGRKLRMREEKYIQDDLEREQKTYRTLGDTPKIITIEGSKGRQTILYKTNLFPDFMLRQPYTRMKEVCEACHCGVGKYRIKRTSFYACSLPCYKSIVVV